jgi:hypothetical protein
MAGAMVVKGKGKGRKRGPKGPRADYEPALWAMVPLVRCGTSVLAAARTVISQGIAPVPFREEATAHRLRSLFAHNRAQLMRRGANPSYTLKERAEDQALTRAMLRSPRLRTRLVWRPHTITPAMWERISAEAREIEREMRLQRELRPIHELQRLNEVLRPLLLSVKSGEE